MYNKDISTWIDISLDRGKVATYPYVAIYKLGLVFCICIMLGEYKYGDLYAIIKCIELYTSNLRILGTISLDLGILKRVLYRI